MWNLKCKTIPVITVATGIVKKRFKEKFGTTPGKHSLESLQKTAILEILHIIREYCSVKLEA